MKNKPHLVQKETLHHHVLALMADGRVTAAEGELLSRMIQAEELTTFAELESLVEVGIART